MVTEIVRFRFTTDEYEQMIAVGILTEEDRVELVDGEIITMSSVNVRHAACVKRLNDLFSRRLGGRVIVSIQDPIRLDDRSEPEPDVAILHRRPDFYEDGHPEPEDIILVIEVADTSLAYDRNVKAAIYARAGIGEYWVVNLSENHVEIYRQPENARYLSVHSVKRGDEMSLLAFPDVAIAVDAILP